MKTWAIAKQEWRTLFSSPLGWWVFGVGEAMLAWLFLGHLDDFLQDQNDLATLEDPPGATELVAGSLFGNTALVLLLLVPFLTMRSVSEELRSKTIVLLFSSPVSMTSVILGKYLGILGFLCLWIVSALLMILSMQMGGVLDLGLVAAGGVGLLLLVASFTAAGLFVSTLTTLPTLAAVGSFGLLLLFWVIDSHTSGQMGGILTDLSLVSHYDDLIRGVFDSADVAYYILFICTFLVLAIRRLDAYQRQQ